MVLLLLYYYTTLNTCEFVEICFQKYGVVLTLFPHNRGSNNTCRYQHIDYMQVLCAYTTLLKVLWTMLYYTCTQDLFIPLQLSCIFSFGSIYMSTLCLLLITLVYYAIIYYIYYSIIIIMCINLYLIDLKVDSVLCLLSSGK